MNYEFILGDWMLSKILIKISGKQQHSRGVKLQ